MGRIKQLSKNVINQIAAGEVIERPFSVVKELVENSIDAASSRISVEITNESRNIRVADNGSGIHPDDIMLAFTKHATSKIETGEDLYNVSTMGFRGEALASIISVAKLTCITRTNDFEYGTKVECENSEVNQSKTGCAVGTVMEIKDLFYSIPARLKFLKSAKTEFAYIYEFMQSVSLIHPDISFELKNNGKTILKTSGQDSLLIACKEIFSDDLTKHFKKVFNTDKLSGLSISGYVSTPDYTRSSKKDYYMYVNSRPVKCPVFQKAIDTVYKNLTANTKYPFIILNIIISPCDVDVNVHPSKKEIRYKNPNQIFNFIYTSINKSLSSDSFTKEEPKQPEQNFKPEEPQEADTILVHKDASITDIFKQKTLPTPEQPEEKLKTLFPVKKDTDIKPKQEQLLQREIPMDEDVIIGQYKKTYILIEREEGLEIVDQHIAEERYIYEQLKKSKSVDSQILFISDVLKVSPSDRELLESNKDKLLRFGYEIDSVSDSEVIFRKVPQILSKVSPQEILSDILENISGDIDNIEEKILITTSCKASVKANTYLNHFQMQEIIRNWRKCEKPFTCPHGRPISKIIEHKDIAKFFQRGK